MSVDKNVKSWPSPMSEPQQQEPVLDNCWWNTMPTLPSLYLLLGAGPLPRVDEPRNDPGTAPCGYAPEILIGTASYLHSSLY